MHPAIRASPSLSFLGRQLQRGLSGGDGGRLKAGGTPVLKMHWVVGEADVVREQGFWCLDLLPDVL